MINSLLKPYKNFKNKCIAKYFIQFSFSQLFQRAALSLFNLTFGVVLRLISASKAVNRRALSTLTATLVLSAFLTACSGGGGGGGSSDTPAPTVPSPSLSLAVSNNALTLSEDFSPALRVATATNATDIRVSQSPRGVVNVTTSDTNVSVSSILNASGRTTLTIVASNSSGSTTAQVVVTVNAVNDPPTLTVSSNSISTVGGFSPITINTTASDIEDANLTFTVAESTAGVVRVTQSANAIVLNNIPNASGQTTLTITAVDSSGTTVTQTISVNVTITVSTAPVVTVSTNLISVSEDFGSVVIRTTVTDSDSTTLSLAVTTSMRLVNVAISTRTNNLSTITLTAIANLNGTATLTFHATDDGGQTNSTEIVVVVAAVNDTPTLTIPTATLTVLEDFDSTTSVATFADVDRGDALTVTVTESSTGIVTVTTSASGVSVAAIKNRNGRTTLNISVSDGTVSSTTQIVVDVTPVNDPPALSVSTSALTLAEDFGSFLIATTRTDIDSTTLTLTVAESAAGVVTVQTSTSGVSVSSIGQRSGRTTLTITLSDSQLSTTTQVVIDVTAVNDPPTLTVSPTALTLNEDFATTEVITVNRSDIDSNTLTLTVAESATGVVTVTTIDAGVQVVSIANASGQTTLTITVSDSQASASTQVVVTVNAVNDPPTLTVSSNSISTVGGFSAITINTTASDIEDDNISFSVINADTRVVRITTSTNAIMLNSMPGASGQTTLTVRVVDSSGAAVTEIITVSVAITPSAAPVVTVSTNLISLQEDFGTSIIVQTTATDGDAADTISVSVSASMPIVTAVISTPANGQSTITNSITLTAIKDANGTATLTVLASDSGGQSHSTEIVVVVSPVQDTPTINIPTATLTVTEDFGSTQTIATASDADGDTLNVSVVESTTGIVTVTTTASGVSVSSIGNANGQTTLTIIVNDGNQDTTGQVVVNVTPVNDPPSLNIPSATLTRAEEFAGAITVATASDVEGNPLTFTVTESTTGVIRVTATSSDVRISSRGEANGVTTLVISVSDGDLTTTAQVVITVTPVNDPPALSVTTTALTLNEDFSTTEVITVSRSDIDSNTLTLTVAESATGVVSVTITDAGVQVTNIRNANGVTTLTLSLSDGELTTTAQVVVTITPVNDPPSLSVSTTALTLNEDFATTEVITVSRSDIDSNTLTLTVSESATGVVTVTITDAGVQVTNISNANGATTLTLSLSDGTTSTSTQVGVTVVPVNDTPTLSVSINNLSLNVDFSTITINTTANDADEGALSFAVQALPANVVTVTTSTNAIMLNAIAGASGQTTLTVRTTDNTGRTAVQTISVIVSPTPNSAPVLVVSTNRISVLEDFMSSVVIRTTATDADGDTITLSVSSTSRFVDVAISTPINGNSTITLSAINNANGQTTLTITVSDSQASVSTQVVVTVNAVNDTPTQTVSSNSITTVGGFSTITINTTASDIEDGALSFTVTASNVNVVTVTTSANAILLNAISGATGQTTLTVRTVDRSGTTVTRTISVNVINSAPVLTLSNSLVLLQEDFMPPVSFSITATDIDGDTITLTVSSITVTSESNRQHFVDTAISTLTNGMSTITLTAIDNAYGIATLFVRATAAGQSVSTNVVVSVVPINDTPTLTVSSNSITTLGGFSTITINTTASDIEDSTLTFTVTASTANVVRVTTSANAILLNAISGGTSQTILTVRTADSLGTTVTQTIAVNVIKSAPVLTVSTSYILVLEDFKPSVMFGITATDIDGDTITHSVSSTPQQIVDAAISTLTNGMSTITLSAIANAHGIATLIVQATADGQSVSENVIVSINGDPDPPTLTVSSNSITTVGGFSTITINTTASDVEDGALTFTVSAVPSGVVTVTTSANAILLNAIPGATGLTTLTVITTDTSRRADTQIISVNVINSAPVLTVSTSLINVQEDFMTSVMFSIAATDIDGDAITFSVSSTTRLVDVALSTPISDQSTITLSAVNNANGTMTLTVQVMDSAGRLNSTNVVVVVAPVNDTPTLTVSSNSITTFEGFSTITINTTANDVDEGALSFSVLAAPTGVVTVTTSANAITLNAISGATGQTTLTVRTADRFGTAVTQTIAVTVISTPVLMVSTSLISVQEDFNSSVVIRTTATDIDGDTITLSVSSTSRFVNVAISTPINGRSTLTNSITLTAIKNANGTTTLTVQAIDARGFATTEQIVVVVNAIDDGIPFSLSTAAVSLSVPGSQLDRIINAIRISNPDNKTLRAQIQVTTSGDNIFSVNPTPVVSFTTNTLTTTATLTSVASTAQLYFTVAPNSFGTATLVVQLTDLDTALMTQQTMIVSVNSPNVPPTIVPASSSITNLVVHGGRLYANDTMNSRIGIFRYLTTARALGGHLANINSVEEYTFVRTIATSGLTSQEAYFGLVLPQRLFPGELSWITHDSTIAYGYSSDNGIGNHTIYPGHFPLPWSLTPTNRGLVANRAPNIQNGSNWTIFAGAGVGDGVTFLVDDLWTGNLGVVYEFPQGLPTIASHSTSIVVVTNASVRLTGYDLNGDAIIANNWSITDPNGGSAVFNNVSQRSGAQTVDMVYTPRPNFDGQTTVAVALQVNGLSTTYPISFIVDGAPSIALSTNTITLNEDFGTFDIGTTATDQGVSTSLPFWVSASRSGIVTISTSANNIELSAVQHANGPVTLTVQTIDSASQSISALIVVNVQAVNDTPTLTVSTNSISILGGVSIITIDTTATDIEDGSLSFSVQSSTTGMLSITTSANAIVLDTIYNASVQTTLTVTVVDSLNTTVVQTIAVNVIITPSATPVLTVSTNLMRVDEDFSNPVVIRTTATDANGDALIISISSSSHLVNAVLSTPTNGVSTLTNSITLTSMTDLNGTTTLTVRATDGGGISVTEQIVVVVNPVEDAIPFTLSTSVVSLSVPGSQLDRIVQSINISNPGNKTLGAQLQLTSSGDPIFSTNPIPVVSFTTNALTTLTTLTSTTSTAQLYFTIAPNSTGTATLTVHLTNLTTSESTQQTLVVQVNPVDVPPAIVPTVSSLTNLVVHGGHLYANSVQRVRSLNPLLSEARALGGQLINFNSDEEYQLILGSAVETHNTWWGLVLPQREFPGELSWITHDSTIAYGFGAGNGFGNLTVYPGQFPVRWNDPNGVIANRLDANGVETAITINGTVYSNGAFLFLLGDRGDGGTRIGLYEFPQGLTPSLMNPIAINSGTSASLSLTGFDLNGGTISTSDWSITDPNGGTATFNNVSQNSGVQRVTMIYTAPANFGGQTTVVVTLQVNGLSSTYPISFMVDGPPTIALSTNAITLAEEFSNFVIGTTVTDQGVSGNQPFSVQTASTGIVNLSTTINSIQFSGALNFNGTVTLTVQATDSTAQTASTLVVVTVQAVNDTPTVTVSTDNISILGGFSPITIDTTATDVDDGPLSFSVQASPQGVVSISTRTNAIVLSPIVGGSGRTTLTVSVIDSGSKTSIQTIAVNVMVTTSASTPVLSVSTNLISLQEEFGSVVIGTTATDVEDGDLVVTVSSTTHLVNTVISTNSITLSSVANLFGTTTLTVRARDDGGVFVSTELVVIVASVNDTPTLTVSPNSVNLGSAPEVLVVTASDVEDGVLSFGTSSGQGYVDIAITTTSLTLTRLNQSGQILLTLTSTDTEGGTASTVVRVTIPAFFDVTTGIKTLDFAWSAVSSATHYQLQSNPNGSAGFADLSTTGMVVSPNSTNIMQTTAQGRVALHRYIPRVSGPQFVVNGCNGASCGASIGNTVALTNAQLNGLIGRFQASNPDSEDRFGWSVALSGDGNTLAVGAYLEDASSTGVNGVQNDDLANTGAVYLYRRMGGTWLQQAYIKASNPGSDDRFGFSVSLNDDGNILAVGANLEDGPATGVNGTQIDGTFESGAVYVFRFSSSTWSQQAYIKASNTGSGDRFGYAVALSGNGNTLAVGARLEDSSSRGVNSNQNNNSGDSGATYLFRFNTTSSIWSQQAYIKASNTHNSDRFGHSVSLNKNGNTLTVGAYREESLGSGVNGDQTTRSSNGNFAAGAVYLFRFSTASSVWSQQAYIKALIVFERAQFGWSVDLNDDGNTLAVGANQDPSNSTGVNRALNEAPLSRIGAAYVFRFSTAANTWSQQAFIKASNAGSIDFFGTSVSISGDGNALVVGAYGEAGSASGVEGINDVFNPILNSGAAYVFEFANGTWAQQAFIKASDTSPGAQFGQSVSISNDGGAIAVGAWGVNTNTGAVYLY